MLTLGLQDTLHRNVVGKYIGYMGDLELQLEIIKDNNRDKDIKTSKRCVCS